MAGFTSTLGLLDSVGDRCQARVHWFASMGTSSPPPLDQVPATVDRTHSAAAVDGPVMRAPSVSTLAVALV